LKTEAAVGEVFVQRTGRYWLDEEGILRGEVLPEVDYQLQDAAEMMALHRRLVEGKARCFMMNITGLRSLPREVRVYFASPEHVDVHRAVALIVGSPISRAIGNFFLGFNKPAMPMRLFSDEERALAWLRSLA